MFYEAFVDANYQLQAMACVGANGCPGINPAGMDEWIRKTLALCWSEVRERYRREGHDEDLPIELPKKALWPVSRRHRCCSSTLTI